ncbi:CRACD-like protein [Orycteropus afer afer]|uniref:CRACD-like protein n=1 Tax=Orycteropus afer afer TaxID=1230840 RepID=A0A8B7BDT2_ORYAF|nr:CRACD-like protein [Orycteropus afer afer]
MISTRVMDIKFREAAEGMGEDTTGKKKSKFKTFKKFFGKKKRKESPSTTGSSTWKQSQAKSEVIALESGPVGYDSEDELEESRGALGSRALSHDSIFIPESGQDPTRPVRVFSQENVCDRIKALQLKIQCNVKMGPPPPPGGLPVKRGDDAGMSSEDDGLPSSPPEMSLLHDVVTSTTIKVSLVSSSRALSPDHTSDASVSPRTSDSSIAPMADFNYPPEFSSCLDNSAAKHKLLVKPRNQRSSKMRRLSSRAQSESLSDLTCTPEEEEYDEKPLPKVSTEENTSSGQQDLGPDRGPEPGESATMLQPWGPHARRARLQHSPALSASMEEGTSPGDDPSSCPTTPEVTEPESGPALCLESLSPPEGSPHPAPDSESQREELSITGICSPVVVTVDKVICASGDNESHLSVCIPEEDTVPPETVTATTLETSSNPDGPDQSVQKEVELTLDVPNPEGVGKESSAVPVPSPQRPKSCLKHKALSMSMSHSISLTPSASESPLGELTPCSLDKEPSPSELSNAAHAESTQEGTVKATPEWKIERGGSELASVKKFSVSSCRARPRTSSVRLLEQPGPGGPSNVQLPLLKSSLAWRSEAALDDFQVLPEPQNMQLDPQKPKTPVDCESQDSGDRVANQAVSAQDAATLPATRDPCPATQELPTCEDRNPFPIKLRSTSLSFKYRDGSSELKGVKRHSAEVRLEKGALTLLPKEEKCQIGMAASARGARSLNDQGKVKARSSEQLNSKPPLPRKPLLQTLTLPHPPTPSQVSPGELEKIITPQDSKKESKMVEKKSPHRAAEKSLSPATVRLGADGQPMPPWITIARQKRQGAPDQPPNQEDRPGVRNLKSEMGKQAKAPERAQESTKQADFVRSKSFLIAPVKPFVERKHGTKLNLKEGLQRGISLSHQNLAQSAVMTEKELNQLKRASYASADQPSWMELARKKSQAWSDMPQIIK